MPFYEYQCSACGHHHEELQKVSDRALRKCPACGRSALRRLVSAPVFRLKGGGWYETDFKHDKEAKRNIAGDKEPAAEAKPAAEGKPEAAKEAPKDTAEKKKPEAAGATAPRKRRVARRKMAGRRRRR
jgi:putative FmdB family regulatory protein